MLALLGNPELGHMRDFMQGVDSLILTRPMTYMGLSMMEQVSFSDADLLNLKICLFSGSACNLFRDNQCTVRLIPH